MSTVFAASGHVAFDTASFDSLTGLPVLGGTEKSFCHWSPNPLSEVLM